MTTRDMVYVALFAALMAALGLFPPLVLPLLGVPITAQSLGVMLAGFRAWRETRRTCDLGVFTLGRCRRADSGGVGAAASVFFSDRAVVSCSVGRSQRSSSA